MFRNDSDAVFGMLGEEMSCYSDKPGSIVEASMGAEVARKLRPTVGFNFKSPNFKRALVSTSVLPNVVVDDILTTFEALFSDA